MVVTKTFWTDGIKLTNTANLCQILEQIIQYDEIALEDHSYIATRLERSRNENSWKLSLNAEGIQGPLNQRSDFKQAKQTCKRLYQEHTAITGDGNKPIPPKQQVRQSRDQQFEGLEEYDYRLGPRTGWRFYPSSRTTHSSSSSHWQKSSDWKSNRSWDSWQSSFWTEHFFPSLFRDVISLAGNLISWQSTECVDRHTYRALHFLMRSCCAVSLQARCSLVVRVYSHTLTSMHLHGASHEAHCLRFVQKTFTPHPRRAMSCTLQNLTPRTGTLSSPFP